MSSYAKFAADAGDQYLTALAEAQENFLKSIAAFTAPGSALRPRDSRVRGSSADACGGHRSYFRFRAEAFESAEGLRGETARNGTRSNPLSKS